MKTALGVLNLDVSRSPADDRHILTELAHARGYDLIDVLTIDESTYMPTAHIAERARSAGATALLAPSFEHFGVSARVLPLVAELVVPDAAGHGNARARQPDGVKEVLKQQHRVLRSVLAAAALIVFLLTAWALWPTPETGSSPAPAVIVLPDRTEDGEVNAALRSAGARTPAVEVTDRGVAAILSVHQGADRNRTNLAGRRG